LYVLGLVCKYFRLSQGSFVSRFGCFRALTGPPGDGLVIPEALVPEGHVVHAPLRGGTGSEGFENHIHDALAGQNVTADNGGLGSRREDRALWYDHCVARSK
jgi:hypothetical protein